MDGRSRPGGHEGHPGPSLGTLDGRGHAHPPAHCLVYSLAKNPRVGWSTIGHYLFGGYILGGVVVTLDLTVIAMAIGMSAAR